MSSKRLGFVELSQESWHQKHSGQVSVAEERADWWVWQLHEQTWWLKALFEPVLQGL